MEGVLQGSSPEAGWSIPHAGERKLWVCYMQTRSKANRNKLVEFYLPLLRSITVAMKRRLPFADPEMLFSEGAIGLIRAVERFQPGMGNKFQTYADMPIRGAMMDGVRSADHIPRGMRSHSATVTTAVEHLRRTLGDTPTLQQVADYLRVDLEVAGQWCREAYDIARKHMSLSCECKANSRNHVFESRPPNVADILKDHSGLFPNTGTDVLQWWETLLQGLSAVERVSVILYFRYGWTMKRIGLHLALSESRISQMHTEILARLRESRSAVEFADIATGGESIRCLRVILPYCRRRRQAAKRLKPKQHKKKATARLRRHRARTA